MELLEGTNLEDDIEKNGALTPDETIAILYELAVALDKAHAIGIVHRDLKPENVFLHERDQGRVVKLLDFGISKLAGEGGGDIATAGLTKTGMMMGTLYMSPEQARGGNVGPGTDIWAVGLIAYRMLTGRVYWEAETIAVLMSQIIARPWRLRRRACRCPRRSTRGSCARAIASRPAVSARWGGRQRARRCLRGRSRGSARSLLRSVRSSGFRTGRRLQGVLRLAAGVVPGLGRASLPSPSSPPGHKAGSSTRGHRQHDADGRSAATRLPIVMGGAVAVIALVGIALVVRGRSSGAESGPAGAVTHAPPPPSLELAPVTSALDTAPVVPALEPPPSPGGRHRASEHRERSARRGTVSASAPSARPAADRLGGTVGLPGRSERSRGVAKPAAVAPPCTEKSPRRSRRPTRRRPSERQARRSGRRPGCGRDAPPRTSSRRRPRRRWWRRSFVTARSNRGALASDIPMTRTQGRGRRCGSTARSPDRSSRRSRR